MKSKLYSREVLPDDYFSKLRDDIFYLIPDSTPLRILDIGCGEGILGRRLTESGHNVSGIEFDESAAMVAKENLDHVYSADIENFDLELTSPPFDLIILSDILEHLIDPWILLKKLRKALKHRGEIIASIPNIQYFPILLNLIRGRFEYRSEGILDRSHLRFFTPKEATTMFRNEGYEIVQSPTIYPYRAKCVKWIAILLNAISLGIFRDFLIGNIYIIARKTHVD